MRRYQKWVLTLGIMAMAPGFAMAAPFSFGQPTDDAAVNSAGGPYKSRNQQVAEDIANALKRGAFHGFEIDIKFQDGLAVLRGKVSDPRQKARASQLVSNVPGVHRIDNRLVVISPPQGAIRQVSAGQGDLNAGAGQRDAITMNQQKAIEIGRSLQGAGLNGYDIEVLFQDGQCVLRGSVATPEQRSAATQLASRVPGVRSVGNQLRIEGQPPQNAGGANPRYAMAAYQQVPGATGAVPATPGPMPGGAEGGAMGAPMPATGPVGRGPVYDNPNIPDYAWPAYAQYPNYAAVTYPSQYSASAWPYIGPFYPYPQVPLNWRKVTLEWSDGYWDLKFDSKTDRWWWFMNPKNW